MVAHTDDITYIIHTTYTVTDEFVYFCFIVDIIFLEILTIPYCFSYYSRKDIFQTFHFHSTIQYWLDKVLSTLYLSNFIFQDEEHDEKTIRDICAAAKTQAFSLSLARSRTFVLNKSRYEFETFIRFIESEV